MTNIDEILSLLEKNYFIFFLIRNFHWEFIARGVEINLRRKKEGGRK